ncbi:hypothetical protein D5R81_18010 [Parashewanella spongiae]|uniref:PDZ domain-containing protein n=1 Tax=Parashewanella spongiae TaxID=342950 RepID=A0A3A6TH09_9GAMM|nr:hypothetical protein D5R81_18010 [Parashewanella spongiae]
MSPAQNNGLKESYVITQVNGENITHKNFDVISEKLATLTTVKEICYLRGSESDCKEVNL